MAERVISAVGVCKSIDQQVLGLNIKSSAGIAKSSRLQYLAPETDTTEHLYA